MSMEKIVVLKNDPFIWGNLLYNEENNCRGVEEDELINKPCWDYWLPIWKKIKLNCNFILY